MVLGPCAIGAAAAAACTSSAATQTTAAEPPPPPPPARGSAAAAAVAPPAPAVAPPAVTLAEKVGRIKAALMLHDGLAMPLAIKQANEMMGLPQVGTLPAQADALLAALG